MNRTLQTIIGMTMAGLGAVAVGQAHAQTNAAGPTYSTQSPTENVPANANGTARAQARKTEAAEARADTARAQGEPHEHGRHHRHHHEGGMEGMDGPHGHGPGDRAEFMGRNVDRMIREIGAKPEQGEKIKAIMRQSMESGKADHEQVRQLHQQRADLLKAATIDRPALESLRQRELQLFDAASKRRTQAMADSAEVLTPEQRVKAADWMKTHRGPGRRGPGERRGSVEHRGPTDKAGAGEPRGAASDVEAGRPALSPR